MTIKEIRRPSFAGFLGVRTHRLSLLQTPPLPLPRAPAQAVPSPALAYSPPPWLLLFCFLALLALSWGRLVCVVVLWFASWVRRRPPIGLRRPPGSILGAILAPKMIIFDGLLWLFLRALFLAFWGCFRCCFSFRFLCFVAAREKGRRAKFDTPSTRKPLFSRCAPAPAEPQGRQQTAQKGIK